MKTTNYRGVKIQKHVWASSTGFTTTWAVPCLVNPNFDTLKAAKAAIDKKREAEEKNDIETLVAL